MFLLIVLVCFPVTLCYASEEQMCYTSGSVAGIVIATVVVTIVMGGLAAAAILYLWKQRSALSGEGKKKKPGSTFFSSSLPDKSYVPPLDQHPDKKPRPEEGTKAAYAFDNPFFKDDEADANNQDAAEKGESVFRSSTENGNNSPNNKMSVAAKLKKSRPFSSLQFPNVFHQGFKKPRALDDNYIQKALQRVEVPLRGHDFTGLGFHICGNMRDGIFVKDVLHRGPALESGKIKAGDRIVGVWVSFGGMVYEDALTILSYASPYDVKLELEKTVDLKKNPASSPTSKTRLASSSFRTGQCLFHPLYRSQSIDDLTQIGKDNHFSAGASSTNSSGKNNNNSKASPAVPASCSSCPKRSQSIEASTSPKPRIHQCPVPKDISNSTVTAIKSATPEVQAKNPISAVKEPKVETAGIQQKAVTAEVAVPESLESSVKFNESSGEEERPTAPPRKIVHIKRKAPAPPPKDDPDTSKTETSVIVHRDAGDENTAGQQNLDKSEELGDVRSLSSESPPPSDAVTVVAAAVEDPTSSPKRKASSLGDLTTLDSSRNKKVQAPSSILERAVSLDLQQSLPEGNLVKQKMILKTPTFEDPEEDPRSESRITSPKLKEAWSKPEEFFHEIEPMETATITNGHADLNHNAEDEPSYFTFDAPDESQTATAVTSTPVKKISDSESFTVDVPFIGDKNISLDETSSSAISLTIPVIKPNFSQYGMLPSPGKSSDLSSTDDTVEPEVIKLESSYKPIFTSNSFKVTNLGDASSEANSSLLSAIDIVNGNGSTLEVSSSSYRTATEDSSQTSALEAILLKDAKKSSLPEISGIRVHGGAAGFAKTLIISTPIEGESISLNADMEPPLPKLEPPV